MSHDFVACRPIGQCVGALGGEDVLRPKECVRHSRSLFMGTASVAFCARRQVLLQSSGHVVLPVRCHAQSMLAKGGAIFGLNPPPYSMWSDAWQRILECRQP